MRRGVFAVIVVFLVGVAQQATAGETTKFAIDLATILPAEQLCGVKFKPEQIAAFISTRIPVDNISFPNELIYWTQRQKKTIATLTSAEQTAYCVQVSRISRFYKFAD